MDGSLIWSKPKARGLGEKLNIEKRVINKFKMNKWERSTLHLLKRSLAPDKRLKNQTVIHEVKTPILSSIDRRAIGRLKFSRIIPMSSNESHTYALAQLANVYLDVSGSMSQEIESLISLLLHLKAHVKMPLWAFSNDVTEARFKNGKLEYDSSGGTSIEPVFDHLRAHKIQRSLIISDGYIEPITDFMLRDLQRNRINVLISAGGNPQKFMDMGIPYLQLEKL